MWNFNQNFGIFHTNFGPIFFISHHNNLCCCCYYYYYYLVSFYHLANPILSPLTIVYSFSPPPSPLYLLFPPHLPHPPFISSSSSSAVATTLPSLPFPSSLTSLPLLSLPFSPSCLLLFFHFGLQCQYCLHTLLDVCKFYALIFCFDFSEMIWVLRLFFVNINGYLCDFRGNR